MMGTWSSSLQDGPGASISILGRREQVRVNPRAGQSRDGCMTSCLLLCGVSSQPGRFASRCPSPFCLMKPPDQRAWRSSAERHQRRAKTDYSSACLPASLPGVCRLGACPTPQHQPSPGTGNAEGCRRMSASLQLFPLEMRSGGARRAADIRGFLLESGGREA